MIDTLVARAHYWLLYYVVALTVVMHLVYIYFHKIKCNLERYTKMQINKDFKSDV